MKTGNTLSAWKHLGLVGIGSTLIASASTASAASPVLINTQPGNFDASSGVRTIQFDPIAGLKHLSLLGASVSIDFAKARGENLYPPFLSGGLPADYNEIVFRLTSPNGTSVRLIDANTFNFGANDSSFNGTITFSSAAKNAVNADPNQPQAGTFRPVSSLKPLNNQSPYGTWSLLAQDTTGFNSLRLYGYRLRLVVLDQDAVLSAISTGLPMALAQRQTIFNAAENATQDVNERLFRLRTQTDDASEVADPSTHGLSKNTGKDVVSSKDSKEVLTPRSQRWEFFAASNYGSNDTEATGATAGFGSDTFGGTVGGEYKVCDHLTLGTAITYLDSDNSVGRNVGDLDTNGAAFSGYASWFARNFYVDALYSFGLFNNDIRRNTLLGSTATASPESRTHTIQLNTGYNIRLRGFVTGPIASLDYINGETESYTEQNGGNSNLRVNAQSYDSLISRIGWQLSREIPTRIGTLTPQIRATWAHEYRNSQEQVDVSLQNSPVIIIDGASLTRAGSFSASANTVAPGNDYLDLGAGMKMQFTERFSGIVDYSTHLFQANSSAQFVSLTASVKF